MITRGNSRYHIRELGKFVSKKTYDILPLMGNCEMGMERLERLDMEGMDLGDRVMGRNGSMYVVFVNRYRGMSGALLYSWSDSSFVHKNIYH